MDTAVALVQARGLHMAYPVPRRIRHYLRHPFARAERITALQDVHLSIRSGDRLAVLGPNGAGKTSLLKLLAGLMVPTRGQVLFRGQDAESQSALLRRSIGLAMNEERSFYWRLTGRQNLVFFGTLNNLPGAILQQRVAELTQLVGLTECIDRRVNTYSSGMRQRLAIARGLLTDPDLLVLDEPTRTLDPVGAQEHVAFIHERLQRDLGKTLLIATHKLGEAEALCQRFCVIRSGRLVADTDATTLARQKLSLEEFYRAEVAS